MKACVGFFVVLGFFSTLSEAKTLVYRNGPYVYFKTPYKELLQSERQEILNRASRVVLKKLEVTVPQISPNDEITEETLERLELLGQNMDLFIKKLEPYTSLEPLHGTSLRGAAPTAFYLFLGGKFVADLKVGGGGAVGLGIMLLPVKVTRIDMISRKAETYYSVENSWIIFGNGQAGAGVGGGPTARVGVGLVWGPADRVEDLYGVTLSASGLVVLGPKGLNLKGGVLKQWGRSRMNPFISVAMEFGPAAAANIHMNFGGIIRANDVLDGLFGDVGQIRLEKEENAAPLVNSELIQRELEHLEATTTPEIVATPPVAPPATPTTTPAPKDRPR